MFLETVSVFIVVVVVKFSYEFCSYTNVHAYYYPYLELLVVYYYVIINIRMHLIMITKLLLLLQKLLFSSEIHRQNQKYEVREILSMVVQGNKSKKYLSQQQQLTFTDHSTISECLIYDDDDIYKYICPISQLKIKENKM